METVNFKPCKLKIGFTGPSGSGKTTLAKYISERFNIPFLAGSASLVGTPENQQFLKDKYDYEPKGHQNVINMSNANPEFGYDFQRLLLESRSHALINNDNFVTDRTPVDNLTYYLMQCSHNQSDSTTKEYISKAAKAFLELDIIFIVKPHDSETEDNGSRVSNNFYQQMTYGVFNTALDLIRSERDRLVKKIDQNMYEYTTTVHEDGPMGHAKRLMELQSSREFQLYEKHRYSPTSIIQVTNWEWNSRRGQVSTKIVELLHSKEKW